MLKNIEITINIASELILFELLFPEKNVPFVSIKQCFVCEKIALEKTVFDAHVKIKRK